MAVRKLAKGRTMTRPCNGKGWEEGGGTRGEEGGRIGRITNHNEREKERIIERSAAGRNDTDADGEWGAYEGEG